MMKNEVTRKTIFVLQVAFIYGILSNLGHPVTPAYLKQLALPDQNFGYFYAAMNLGMLLTAPLWGSFGDSKNRKLMVVLGLIVYAIGQFMFGLFDTSISIILVRLISGFGSGAIMVSMLSYISKSSILVEKKKEVTGSFIVFNILGGSIGAALGGIIGNSFINKYEYVMFIQAGLLVLYALYLLCFHSTKDEVKGDVRSKNPFASLKDIKNINGWYMTYLLVLFLLGISFTNVAKYLDKLFTDTNHTTLFIGVFSLIVGLVTLLTNIFILPRVLKKNKSYTMIIGISLLSGVLVFATFNIPNMIGIFTIYFLYIMCKTILEPLTVSFLNENTKISTGILMGVRQSFISLGAIVGIIVAGYIYDYSNILLFNICSVIFILCALILFSIKNMKGR